jgi:hypothetical protein
VAHGHGAYVQPNCGTDSGNFRRLQKAVSLFILDDPFQQHESLPGPSHCDERSRDVNKVILKRYYNNIK